MKKVEVTLTDANLRSLEELERRRVLCFDTPAPRDLEIRVLDAAINQGFIKRYVKTPKDRLIPVLCELNTLELSLRRRILPQETYDFRRENPPYSELVQHISVSPSILEELNHAVSNHNLHFTESHFGIQMRRGPKQIVLDDLADQEAVDVLTAAEKVLQEHKEGPVRNQSRN